MLKPEYIKGLFVEIDSMRIDMPQHPSEFYKAITGVQNYLNRLSAIQLEILSELVSSELLKQERSQLKYLREGVDLVASNLKTVKQQIALLVNNSEIFDIPKAPKERELSESDIPGQNSTEDKLDFHDEEDLDMS